jgi:hypothetical protein
MKISVTLPILSRIAKADGEDVFTAKGLKKAMLKLSYYKVKIDPGLSTNIGVEQEIANSNDPENKIRQSILN